MNSKQYNGCLNYVSPKWLNGSQQIWNRHRIWFGKTHGLYRLLRDKRYQGVKHCLLTSHLNSIFWWYSNNVITSFNLLSNKRTGRSSEYYFTKRIPTVKVIHNYCSYKCLSKTSWKTYLKTVNT